MTIPEPKQLAAWAVILAGVVVMAVGIARSDMAWISASSALLGGPAIAIGGTKQEEDTDVVRDDLDPQGAPPGADQGPEEESPPIPANPVPAQRSPLDTPTSDRDDEEEEW